MKNSDMKIIAIILSIALFFTIVTSNAVSIASVVLLALDKGTTTTDAPAANAGTPGSTATGGTVSSGTTGGTTATTPDAGTTGGTSTDAGTTGGSTATTPDAGSQGGSTATTPDANKPADNGGAAAGANDKAAIVKMYTDAAQKVRAGGAGFDRKTWQAIQSVELGSLGDKLLPIIESFMTKEADAAVKTYTKEDAKNKMPKSTFTAADVASATSAPKGANTLVTIIMNDEQSPVKDAPTGVAAAAGYEILYMADVKETIAKDFGFIALTNESMTYKGFKIEAEITKDGKLVDIMMSCPGHLAATVGITVITVDAKGVLEFYSHYNNFKY